MTPSLDKPVQAEEDKCTVEHPPEFYAMLISTLIEEMDQAVPTSTPPERFRRLCDLAATAFPDGKPNDAAVLLNPATPALMRYLLASLRRFASRTGGATAMKTNGRYRALAESLLASGEPGMRSGKWTTEKLIEYVNAGAKAYREVFDKDGINSGSRPAAHRAAVSAAYSAYRGDSPGEEKSGDRKRAKMVITKLLMSHGYSP